MSRGLSRIGVYLRQPLGRAGWLGLILLVLLVPAGMFRVALWDYRLHSDDFEYLAASRTFGRAWANLYRPHNTHVVPAWRLLTAGVMQAAGRLPRLQETLAVATYGALAALMLAVGWCISRETGRPGLGVGAAIATGTTSVLFSSGTWYSSGQTVWAALGIVGMLLALQSWRRTSAPGALLLAAGASWLAGSMWTIGHAAGPVGCVYLLGHRRPLAALLPIGATLAAVVLAWSLGGRQIDARISFHGRTQAEAADPVAGWAHTVQAIPEQLVGENLGLEPETTVVQGAALTVAIALVWLITWRRARPTPLELAGATLVLLAYYVEWTFRGYLPFSSLRTVVPWYDTIPHVGAVLFGAGWMARLAREQPDRLTRGAALGLVGLSVGLALVHQPRVEALLIAGVPRPDAGEPALPPTREFQLARALYLWSAYHEAQRVDLARLEQVQALARRLGIGRDAIERVFGRVELLELPPVYDALGLLDLPERGREQDDARVRAALADLMRPTPAPRFRLPAPPASVELPARR
ncbi:MAG: hypothetical protein KatS3mg108_3370 [Isosphaeraceae bacterium]|nr:MAG: hypothetical protein KatS3mg108_3370 [Isosphaeraceae bacterium]